MNYDGRTDWKKNNNRTDGVRHRFASARQKGGIGKENKRTKIGILNKLVFESSSCRLMSESQVGDPGIQIFG